MALPLPEDVAADLQVVRTHQRAAAGKEKKNVCRCPQTDSRGNAETLGRSQGRKEITGPRITDLLEQADLESAYFH